MAKKSIGKPIDMDYRYADNLVMHTKTAVNHFGSQKALAEALGITQPSVAEWGEFPPPLRQIQIQAVTCGELEAEPGCLPTAPTEQRSVA